MTEKQPKTLAKTDASAILGHLLLDNRKMSDEKTRSEKIRDLISEIKKVEPDAEPSVVLITAGLLSISEEIEWLRSWACETQDGRYLADCVESVAASNERIADAIEAIRDAQDSH